MGLSEASEMSVDISVPGALQILAAESFWQEISQMAALHSKLYIPQVCTDLLSEALKLSSYGMLPCCKYQPSLRSRIMMINTSNDNFRVKRR
ncbi:uncharacterized protein EKO05_0005020 [Ascochyta rabiei]|uniref:uncharacterized protein n=1 Tax=Didymella rabiei TaxID=5454 RepID=UPI00220C83F8|nr:uncharacterized protein EKO05_0005020 [Ascochyta rabiei]UPX14542.1 hypothetical protein EKO05_0005020 [Ascochyta rabiei]